MASRDTNRPLGTSISFGSLEFPFSDEGEAIKASEARPPPSKGRALVACGKGGDQTEVALGDDGETSWRWGRETERRGWVCVRGQKIEPSFDAIT
jgi:hypothetical protein